MIWKQFTYIKLHKESDKSIFGICAYGSPSVQTQLYETIYELVLNKKQYNKSL